MRIRDCSSDVCSSDLSRFAAASGQGYRDRLMATALCNARVLLPLGLRDDICVVIEGARIRAVSSSPPADAEIVDLGGKLLLPDVLLRPRRVPSRDRKSTRLNSSH